MIALTRNWVASLRFVSLMLFVAERQILISGPVGWHWSSAFLCRFDIDQNLNDPVQSPLDRFNVAEVAGSPLRLPSPPRCLVLHHFVHQHLPMSACDRVLQLFIEGSHTDLSLPQLQQDQLLVRHHQRW